MSEQFRDGVRATQEGENMLGAFVDFCGLRGSWRMDDFVDEQLAKIRNKCEDGAPSSFW